jgi:hypothetical protein
MEIAAPPTTTTLGTPASPKWDPEWLAKVDALEQSLDHRICGAHTPAWTPCKLTSTHPNGRCRFHGGAPGIGAPNGNRNAIIHGLYSRRLQQCGEHCPLWRHCPMAGDDVLELELHERPHCAYEHDEYVATLGEVGVAQNSSASIVATAIQENPASDDLCVSAPPREPNLIQRNVALFQVMLSRAQAALGIARLTDENTAVSRHYEMRSTKTAALVQAQLSIARELRAWLKFLPQFNLPRGPRLSPTTPPEPKKPEGSIMRAMKVLEETEGFLEAALGLPPGETSPFSPGLPRKYPPLNPA